MAYQLELPDIGEGVVEAEVQQWFVKPGDDVVEDQPIVEVMTDKATVTIPSPRRGRIVKLFWSVGDVAKVHAPLVEMELEDAPAARPSTAAARPEPARAPEPAVPATPTESARPDFGEQHAAVHPERSAAAGGAESNGGAPHSGATATGFQDAAPGHKSLATPAVRALAREMGVDVNAVEGTGPGGRVTKEDLQAFRAQTNGRARPPAAAAPSPTSTSTAAPSVPLAPSVATPQASRSRGAPEARAPGTPDERIPLRGLRKRIAENMARSKRTAAHFTFVEQCDVTELVRVKDRIAAAAGEEGVRMTFLPFVVKAVVAALRKHPMLNAALDEERGEIVVKRRYDLGIASATENGLVVPVVRGADRRSLLDLAREIERLAADSKAGRSRPEDMGNSTFTITSLGALGGVFATPVLNHPEVGILGVHRIRPTPVVKDGQIVARDVMHVSVTSDHRVVDGHEAARFAYDVIRYLEDPNLLFMQMI